MINKASTFTHSLARPPEVVDHDSPLPLQRLLQAGERPPQEGEAREGLRRRGGGQGAGSVGAVVWWAVWLWGEWVDGWMGAGIAGCGWGGPVGVGCGVVSIRKPSNR